MECWSETLQFSIRACTSCPQEQNCLCFGFEEFSYSTACTTCTSDVCISDKCIRHACQDAVVTCPAHGFSQLCKSDTPYVTYERILSHLSNVPNLSSYLNNNVSTNMILNPNNMISFNKNGGCTSNEVTLCYEVGKATLIEDKTKFLKGTSFYYKYND